MTPETGIPISDLDPKRVIRRNAESAVDWEYRDEARFLYELSVVFRDELIDPLARIDRDRMPDPIIGFDETLICPYASF